MRIPIREQLTAFTLVTTLAGLAVIAIATWITNHNFVLSIRSSQLALIASLKAAQVSSNLALMEATILGLSTRIKMQSALESYINGNHSDSNWDLARFDLYTAISSTQQTVWTFQSMMFPRPMTSGPTYSVINVTNPDADTISLPYSFPNGSKVILGDTDLGYPKQLYPNITYQIRENNSIPYFNSQRLGLDSSILLGPWQVNETLSLVSITLPIINISLSTDILGWLTVVYDTQLLIDIVASSVGLGRTGVVLLLGPVTLDNRFSGTPVNESLPFPSYSSVISNQEIQFVLPVSLSDNFNARSGPNIPFRVSSYRAVLEALTTGVDASNNASSIVNTYNENGAKVGVGYAIPPTRLCDWLLIVEESHEEVYQPIVHLRNLLLACVLIVAAVMILITWPLAHLSVRPIRRLRAATAKSIEPPGLDSSSEKLSTISNSFDGGDDDDHDDRSEVDNEPSTQSTGLSAWAPLRLWRGGLSSGTRSRKSSNRGMRIRRKFRIPAKVKESHRTCIQDELSELTHTFNEMSEELSLHYHRLEERVRQRTAELELSKKAAEAANESKTLFIANISHELKSPLNAILGLAAVCMQEQDHEKVQQSLSMIYKSGDLLHNLLTDLLTFSKNQAGHQISLEEKEFSLRDIPTQLKVIFDMQAKESLINLTFDYEGVADSLGDRIGVPVNRVYGPLGTGRVKDMQVYGDKHRILQVAINLLSNSLKFTPPGGCVAMRIRCLEEREDQSAPPRGEFLPTRNSGASYTTTQSKKVRYEKSDGVTVDAHDVPSERPLSESTNLSSGGHGEPRRSASLPRSIISNGSDSMLLPPPNAKTLIFEFEVQDTGPGIAPHLQKQIFEPFVQGDLRLTKRYGGTGLGLAIVSQLAKLMNGSISVKSELNVGSTFKLRIPLQLIKSRRSSQATSNHELGAPDSYFASRVNANIEEPESADQTNPFTTPAAATAPSSRKLMSKAFETDKKPRLIGLSQPYFSTATTPPLSSPGVDGMSVKSKRCKSKLRVLVAEDNQINQEVVLRMLRLEDIFDVHIAKDGQEALEKVQESMEAKEPYELIFMDVQMPNLDGRQSARAIRKIGYSAPIVALTAFADEANQKECLESGMNYFLAKPIRRPALRQVLKTYCTPIVEVVEEKSLEFVADLDASSMPDSEDGAASRDGASTTDNTDAAGTSQTRPSIEYVPKANGVADPSGDHESGAGDNNGDDDDGKT